MVSREEDGMSVQSHKLLRILSLAFGADSISTGSEFGMMAQTAAQSAIPASARAALEVACAVNSANPVCR